MLKKFLYQIVYSMQTDLNEKKWFRFLAKFTAFLAAGGCAGYAVGSVMEVLIKYRENIIFALGALVCLLVFWIGFTADKPKAKQETPQAQDDTALIECDAGHVEATYKKLRFALYYLLLEEADILKLKKPASPSQLEAPVHNDMFGANTIIYHYLAFRAGEIDCNEVQCFLEKSLEDKLFNCEIDGFPPDIICGGVAYPSIMVYSVKKAGDFAQINLVIPTDEYVRHRQRQLYRRTIERPHTTFKDKDF